MRRVILTGVFMALVMPGSARGADLGFGVILGSPTGLAFKYRATKRSAFAAHAGWSFIDNPGIHLTGDYQHLFPMTIETEEGTTINDLTLYIAAGGRFRFKKVDATDETNFHLGLRIGGGAEYRIDRFGIFLEIVPVVDLIPETDVDLEGGLGFLFYF
ncbi:hypothetical protein IBX73_03155 [candidate division WOR-3 bacterium]|nr:hypothetical protein [candidate division WOR-3 bacterium]